MFYLASERPDLSGSINNLHYMIIIRPVQEKKALENKAVTSIFGAHRFIPCSVESLRGSKKSGCRLTPGFVRYGSLRPGLGIFNPSGISRHTQREFECATWSVGSFQDSLMIWVRRPWCLYRPFRAKRIFLSYPQGVALG